MVTNAPNRRESGIRHLQVVLRRVRTKVLHVRRGRTLVGFKRPPLAVENQARQPAAFSGAIRNGARPPDDPQTVPSRRKSWPCPYLRIAFACRAGLVRRDAVDIAHAIPWVNGRFWRKAAVGGQFRSASWAKADIQTTRAASGRTNHPFPTRS